MGSKRLVVWLLLVAVPTIGFLSFKASRPLVLVDLGSTSTANTLPKGQCTWYAFERTLGAGKRIRFARAYGRDAKQWPSLVVNRQLAAKPTPGSVMVLDGWKGNPYGHVAYVESVQSAKAWTISHANMSVGEEFAKFDGVAIRKVECLSNPDHTISFKGFRLRFHLLGFLTPK